MSAIEYIRAVVDANPQILSVSTLHYAPPPGAQSRAQLCLEDLQTIERAMSLRADHRLPFWDAVMLSCFDNEAHSDELFRAALFHQHSRDSVQYIDRASVVTSEFFDVVVPEGRILAFRSELIVEGDVQIHVPLLDFHCPASRANDGLVSRVCRILFDGNAAVFRSGKSYHAYGTRTVDKAGLLKFLYRSLLFAPIIDRSYIAHQLTEGSCALRLTATADKPLEPRFAFFSTEQE